MRYETILRQVSNSRFSLGAKAARIVHRLIETDERYRLFALDDGVEHAMDDATQRYSKMDYAVFRDFNILCYLDAQTSAKYNFANSKHMDIGQSKLNDACTRFELSFNSVFVDYLPFETPDLDDRVCFTSLTDILAAFPDIDKIPGDEYNGHWVYETPKALWHRRLSGLFSLLDSIPIGQRVRKLGT